MTIYSFIIKQNIVLNRYEVLRSKGKGLAIQVGW